MKISSSPQSLTVAVPAKAFVGSPTTEGPSVSKELRTVPQKAGAPRDPESLQAPSPAKTKRVVALCLLATAACIGIGVGLGTRLHSRAVPGLVGVEPTNVTSATGPVSPPAAIPTSIGSRTNSSIAPWLYIAGSSFFQADANYLGFGEPATTVPFLGRGANLQDTRDCRLCATDVPLDEVFRRIDALSAIPGVNMMRLTLESDKANQTLTSDLAYQKDVASILRYAGTKPNFYVQASLWINPTLTAQGIPSNASATELKTLVKITGNASHVLFGVSNEPKANNDGSLDADVYGAMNRAVQAIRDAESSLGVGSHIVTVQGTRNWAGDVSYYLQHPITSGGGKQVAYELHAYANASFFASRIAVPAKALPLIISEFGPSTSPDVGAMKLADTGPLMQLARSLRVPHLAWNFNSRCGPSLLDDNAPKSACPTLKQSLTLTNPWGKTFVNGMAAPWSI